MKRTRKTPYYYVNDQGTISYTVDNNSEVDKRRHEIGNYFDEHEARKAQAAFLSLFKKQTFLDRIKNIIQL